MSYAKLTHCEFHDLVKRGEAAGLPPHPRVSWMRGPEGKDGTRAQEFCIFRFPSCTGEVNACPGVEVMGAIYEVFWREFWRDLLAKDDASFGEYFALSVRNFPMGKPPNAVRTPDQYHNYGETPLHALVAAAEALNAVGAIVADKAQREIAGFAGKLKPGTRVRVRDADGSHGIARPLYSGLTGVVLFPGALLLSVELDGQGPIIIAERQELEVIEAPNTLKQLKMGARVRILKTGILGNLVGPMKLAGEWRVDAPDGQVYIVHESDFEVL